jgi:hypothetical protein
MLAIPEGRGKLAAQTFNIIEAAATGGESFGRQFVTELIEDYGVEAAVEAIMQLRNPESLPDRVISAIAAKENL